MPVYKSKSETKDGRSWFFKVQYSNNLDPEPKTMISKKYASKNEAMEAEHDFLISVAENKNVPVDMTFSELYQKFLEFKKDKVKHSTWRTYDYQSRYIQCFMKVKCVDYNIKQYDIRKKKMTANKKICTYQKNHILKFWKSILNFGSNWYGFNFTTVYKRMTNFTNPNERKKEMQFYTLDEFKLFLSGEDDLRYRCIWQTLFYCGLRCGEARGLTWDCIDFINKRLTVSKQVQDAPPGSGKKYEVVSPKTSSSYRTIPICTVLLNDLKKYKDELMATNENFNDSLFVLGEKSGTVPFEPNNVRIRKLNIATTLGLKVIRTHDFRHSCASLLINSGGNVTMVAKYLGHSEIDETLNTYSHLFPSALDNVLNIINKLQ